MFHPTLSSPAGSLKDLPRAEGQCGGGGGGGATRFRVNFIIILRRTTRLLGVEMANRARRTIKVYIEHAATDPFLYGPPTKPPFLVLNGKLSPLMAAAVAAAVDASPWTYLVDPQKVVGINKFLIKSGRVRLCRRRRCRRGGIASPGILIKDAIRELN